MSFQLGARSLKNLEGVHPDLVKVVKRAIGCTTIDFMVIEGRRTLARQKQLMTAGATRTLNSRHLTGHAVDIVPYVGGKVRWDWPLYHELAKVMKKSAADLGIPIQWGGDWKSFKDGPHWELPWAKYPK